MSTPELNHIQQSQYQLAYLQAQLAATEALHAAYQEELDGLRGQLKNAKRDHLRSGQSIWKEPSKAAAAPRSSSWAESDPATFSDIEEEVLLQPDDDLDPKQQPQQPDLAERQPQQQAQEAQEGPRPPPPPQQPDAAGPEVRAHSDCPAGGGTEGAGPPGSAAAAAAAASGGGGGDGKAGTAAAAAWAAGPGPGSTAAAARLMELEAVCSAVAAEDMEAQGALACLAGRAAKYYLRSTLVTLGRATESKGDVDLDLGLEEAAAAAAGRRGGRPSQQQQAQAAAAPAEPTGTGTAGAAPAASSAAASRHRVSRRAAMIRLGADGQFRLTNTGRQAVVVNDVEVPPHTATTLPHLSLLRVADVCLLFMANPAAVARCVRRSAALVM